MRFPAALIGAVLVLSALSLFAAEDALDAARREYAMHFMSSADAHLALARVLRDRGDRLRAFFISESARRDRFPEDEFNAAFAREFLKPDAFDNSPDAEAKLRAALQKNPQDADAANKLADIYISRSEWEKAIPLLQLVVKARPENFSPVSALAEVDRRSGKEKEADAITSKYVSDHPTTAASYRMRIEDVVEKDPAAATKLADEAIAKYPADADLRYLRGAVSLNAGKYDEAEPFMVEAAKLGPENAAVQGWVGRFFLKAKKDPARALDYYLNAYFLEPDFYDTEYAEGRIRTIAYESAQARAAASANVVSLLRDRDPVVVSVALESLKSDWKPAALNALASILRDDDETNRWNAMLLIADHADASFDKDLDPLLRDADFRVRGMAAYLALKLRGSRMVPAVASWLDDPAELIRYDAVSALLMNGGDAGRKAVEAYAASGREKSEVMRNWMGSALEDRD